MEVPEIAATESVWAGGGDEKKKKFNSSFPFQKLFKLGDLAGGRSTT